MAEALRCDHCGKFATDFVLGWWQLNHVGAVRKLSEPPALHFCSSECLAIYAARRKKPT